MPSDRETIRRRYASAAGTAVDPMMKDGGTCGAAYYDEPDLGSLPLSLVDASLGCANPVAVAELGEGEIVLDLGSGAGVDVLLSARRVGPTGIAYGVDMTDEMLELARQNAADAGVTNVEFLKGYIEDLPLPDAAVDVVLSNCVINLSHGNAVVFQEMSRVLRPGGRLAIADLVADEELDDDTRRRVERESPCLAGALTRRAYRMGLKEVGLADISITDSHETAPGFTSVIVRAKKQENPRLPMPSIELHGPYQPRRIRFCGLWEPNGWRLKVYGIAYGHAQPDDRLVAAIKNAANETLPQPAVTENRYGLGFIAAHQGRTVSVAFVDWWENEDELHHKMFVADAPDVGQLRAAREDELTACSWDLAVIAFEWEAWVRHILQASEPDGEAYLRAQLNADV